MSRAASVEYRCSRAVTCDLVNAGNYFVALVAAGPDVSATCT
jgi:hypothetical protein